jgi:Ala-tRNA(Pro) deacylase
MNDPDIRRATSFLDELGIEYEKHDHPAVFTVDEVTELVSIGQGARTKNLFVRDKKGRRHVLIVVPHDLSVDLMALGQITGHGRLSFASSERLRTHLGVEPGSVTLLGVINDQAGAVEVIMDERIWNAPFVRCHPLKNTATLVIGHKGIETVFRTTGHEPVIMKVPAL